MQAGGTPSRYPRSLERRAGREGVEHVHQPSQVDAGQTQCGEPAAARERMTQRGDGAQVTQALYARDLRPAVESVTHGQLHVVVCPEAVRDPDLGEAALGPC